MRSRLRIACATSLAVLSLGCVSKKQYQALETQLAEKQKQVEECLADKKSAQEMASGLQKRLSADDERFSRLETTMNTTIPEMAAEFQEDRKRILTLVPREIRSQVGERLDQHFASVNTRLSGMQATMTEMEQQLSSAREELTALRGQTQGVSEKVDQANATLSGENADLKKRLEAQRARASELTRQVTDFDANYLNCANCEERLKMKEKSRQALRTLHGALIAGLSELQAKK